MVNTALIIISVISLIAWLVYEKLARPDIIKNMDETVNSGVVKDADQLQQEVIPAWARMLTLGISGIWLIWVIAVFLIKDGDFALVLVWLTIFAGIVAGLDKFLFEKARKLFENKNAYQTFIARYNESDKEKIEKNIVKESIVAEYARSFFPVLLIVTIVRSFIVEPFQIPSASMVPTLRVGDYILVNKFTYGVRLPVLNKKIIPVGEPKRGDVMVFFPPQDKRYFIKRVIGLPGDVVSYKDRRLSVNGVELPKEFIAEFIEPDGHGRLARLFETSIDEHVYNIHNTKGAGYKEFTTTVKPGHYFMMGDNRDNSSDSRYWGQVPEENIVGKAFATWMFWPSITSFPKFDKVGKIQ